MLRLICDVERKNQLPVQGEYEYVLFLSVTMRVLSISPSQIGRGELPVGGVNVPSCCPTSVVPSILTGPTGSAPEFQYPSVVAIVKFCWHEYCTGSSGIPSLMPSVWPA